MGWKSRVTVRDDVSPMKVLQFVPHSVKKLRTAPIKINEQWSHPYKWGEMKKQGVRGANAILPLRPRYPNHHHHRKTLTTLSTSTHPLGI